MARNRRTSALIALSFVLLTSSGCERDERDAALAALMEINYDSVIVVPRPSALGDKIAAGRTVTLGHVSITLPEDALDAASMYTDRGKEVPEATTVFDLGVRRVLVVVEEPGGYGQFDPEDLREHLERIDPREAAKWDTQTDYDLLTRVLSATPKGTRDSQRRERYSEESRILLVTKVHLASRAIAIWKVESPSYEGFLVQHTAPLFQLWLFSRQGAYQGRILIGTVQKTPEIDISEEWFGQLLASLRIQDAQ